MSLLQQCKAITTHSVMTKTKRTYLLVNLLGFIILSATVWTGCDTGVTGVEGAVIDNPDNPYKLRQLLFVIRLVDRNGRYIVSDRIDSVRFKVNGDHWGVFTPDPLNTQGVAVEVDGNYQVTDREIGYLVTAGYQLGAATFETAGEYSSYLNRRLRLEPGDYVAEIAEVHFRDISNSSVIISPRIYIPFSIDEGKSSMFLGEFTIPVE